MPDINWLAVLLAALSTFVIGGLWYGPLFGKRWMALTGITEESVKSANMVKIYGLTFVLSFLAAAVFAAFLGPEIDVAFGTAAGFAAGLFWVAGSLGTNYLFEQKPLGLWLINGGYDVAKFTAFGAIIGAMN